MVDAHKIALELRPTKGIKQTTEEWARTYALFICVMTTKLEENAFSLYSFMRVTEKNRCLQCGTSRKAERLRIPNSMRTDNSVCECALFSVKSSITKLI